MNITEIKKRAKEEFGAEYPSYYSDDTVRAHYENLCAAKKQLSALDPNPRTPTKGKRKE